MAEPGWLTLLRTRQEEAIQRRDYLLYFKANNSDWGLMTSAQKSALDGEIADLNALIPTLGHRIQLHE